MKRANRKQDGFTLIEVALAVLAMGLGILVIFSLIPASLRLAEDGRADTRCGEFTEVVMQGMRAKAAAITNWAEWNNPRYFTNAITADILLDSGVPQDLRIGAVVTNRFPLNGTKLRYKLTVNTGGHSAFLEVCDGEYGLFDSMVSAYTEFAYQGD
jgi:hypothetical protein